MALTRITSGVISANVVTSEKLQNSIIQARHIQAGALTTDLFEESGNAAAVEIRVNANVDIVQDNVVATQANVDILQDNVNTTTSNISTLTASVNTIYANVNTVQDNVALNVLNIDQVQSNVDIISSNLNGVIDGTVPFTGPVTMQDSLTVQGNLIVVGAQVDLGVGTATIDDNFIVVSANLTGVPATDSGIIINRGSEGNVFIGDHIGEDAIVFATTQSPHDNATIAIQEYIDVHANAFHAHQSMNFNVVHFGHVNDESTGIIIDTSNTQIKFIIGGTEVANIDAQANLVLNDGKITGSPNASGERNAIDLDVDEEPSVVNSVGIFSVNSIFMGLDTNNNGDSTYFGIFNDTDDLSTVTRDTATFSVRDYGEVFVSDDISVQGNANIILDAVVSNAVIGTRVFEGTVGLQANDSATYFAAYANDYVTYTRLNANVNTVQSNLSTAHTDLSSNIDAVQDNVAALSGGGTFLSPFTNVNTATGTSNVFFVGRNIAAEANVLLVMLDGVSQPNTEYEVNASNDTVQMVDATIPSGTIVQIFSMS